MKREELKPQKVKFCSFFIFYEDTIYINLVNTEFGENYHFKKRKKKRVKQNES